MQKVVVYYYSSRWIPIMFYSYSDAIALHHKARLSGKELYLFPPGLDPNDFNRQEVIPCNSLKTSAKANPYCLSAYTFS